MDHFVIDGGRPLRGTVRISGSKNAALPILIATLLTDEPCAVENVPDLRDIRTTARLLESLGKRVVRIGGALRVEPHRRLKLQAPYDLVKQMRASVLAAGPLLARFGRVRVPIPGGCAIGLRPIDIHLKGFSAMGARLAHEHGDIVLKAARLKPARIALKYPSVGATENLMMAAARVPGITVIRRAAREPEIEDLALFLTRMGAEIEGAGTPEIKIRGTASLRGVSHAVIADRIEAGTFLIAAAATRSSLRLDGARARDLQSVIEKLRKSGARISEDARGLSISMAGRPRPVSVSTAPHPGFPTDLQAPWLALMALSTGTSRIKETVFENRFLHAAELARMGALIDVSGHTARVLGIARLNGAPVMASDLRAGAALLVAALSARGQTALSRVYHVDRGYERIEAKLRRVGARVQRISR